jgi:hypothetical protein
MAEAWRLVPLEDSRNNLAVSNTPTGDPLNSIGDKKVLKKARAIWNKIKDAVVLDTDQRVVYNTDEKGSPLPLLLSFLVDGKDSTRPVDMRRFISLIKPYVSANMLARSKRKLWRG